MDLTWEDWEKLNLTYIFLLTTFLCDPNENSFETYDFRKPTYTAVTTKFDFYIPIKYKGNLISTLIYRAYKISKNYLFSKEISFITNIPKKNECPLNFILRYIKKTKQTHSPSNNPIDCS